MLFCTEEQVAAELRGCLSLVNIIFTTLGMDDYRVRVGLRDPDDSKYVGEPEKWDRAEQACREVVSLPIYPELTEEQQRRVVDSLAAFYRS